MYMQHFANTHTVSTRSVTSAVVGAAVVRGAQERKLRVMAGNQDQMLAPEPHHVMS